MSLAEKLALGLVALGLELPHPTRERLIEYLALLHKWNNVYNLTAVREKEKMVAQHLLDCLAVSPHLDGRTVVDVGSGAGLPGIPLALARPEWRVTLLEAGHKKAAFLRQAVIELELRNATVVCDRVEKWQPAAQFDVVISRAFSDLAEFVALAGRLCARDGVIAAMKGVHPYEELSQVPRGFGVRGVIPLRIPGLRRERHLVLLQPG